MKKPLSFALTAVSLALLQACGGGGSSDAGNAPAVGGTVAATTTNTGSVTAAFNRGAMARYQLTSVGSQSFGVLSTSVQDAGGAVTTINSNVLGGSTSVKEIAGDATYAMGRWAAGTVTTSSGATTLTGTDNRAFHYIAINVPAAFPATGSLACSAGAFTSPTYTGGGATGTTGTATGSATLIFGAGGATVGGSVNVTAAGSAGTVALSGSIATPTSSSTILNNSRTNVQTQLGGYVQGNPWLARGSARVIVNEVNSSNPSYLRGFVEVAGPRAEVIVANPSGNRVNPIVEVPSAVGGTPGVAGNSASVANTGNGSGVTGGSAGGVSANGATSAAVTPIGNSAGMSAGTASGIAASASTPASGVNKAGVPANQSLVVRTTAPDTRIPTASLFRTLPGSASHYLVETDPAFASYRNWLSSDYLLNALSYDPATVTKRLGDGFYEQRLIREQVAQLTGYRYLKGSKDDQDQYTALMNAGATFAKAYQLTPGIGLSAAQMAQLTSDIVWLVEQTVTLADGSTQKVLVPQVYVRVKPGDIDGSGALLSADTLIIKNQPGQGDVINSGTIAGRTMVSITADNVQNLNGRISGGSVGVEARNDLNSIGGTIDALNAVSLKAGHDITIASTTQTAVGAKSSSTQLDRVAGVYVTNPGGTLVASAGHDVNLVGAILSNAGAGGVTPIKAGNDINLGTVKTGSSQDTTWNAKNFSRSSESAEVGSTIVTNGTTVLNADRDVNLRQSTIDAGTGLLSIHADRNITLAAGQSTQTAEEARSSKKSGFFTSKTTTTRSTSDETLSHGTSLSGGLVSITANGNITGEGVKISGTDGVLVHADGKLDLHEARDVRSQSNSVSVKKSGTANGFAVLPLPLGASSRDDNSTSSNTAVASSITSANGGVLLQGDGSAILRGVQVAAAKDIAITGGAVSITGATDYGAASSEQYRRGMGLSAIAAAATRASAAEINLASQAGANAAANNYLSHLPFAGVREIVAKENARLSAACEPNCTAEDFRRIDQQAAAMERAADLTEVAKRSVFTAHQAEQLAQTLIELAPVYGTGEAVLQLITGRSSLTGEEASRIWAAAGLVPIAGGIVRKAGEPAVEALTSALRALEGPVFKTTKEATQAAEALGFKRINEKINGQAVYKKGAQYITRDVDGHNGGAWKAADSVANLGKKETRLGTFDAQLNRIGN